MACRPGRDEPARHRSHWSATCRLYLASSTRCPFYCRRNATPLERRGELVRGVDASVIVVRVESDLFNVAWHSLSERRHEACSARGPGAEAGSRVRRHRVFDSFADCEPHEIVNRRECDWSAARASNANLVWYF